MSEALDFLRSLYEHAAEGVVLATLKGKPFFVNPAGRRMLGLDEGQDVETAKLGHLYDDQTWRQIKHTAIPAVRSSGHWQGEGRLLRSGPDDCLDVSIVAFLVHHPRLEKPICLALLHEDLSIRKQAEAGKILNEAILESSLDPIITVNHEGVITVFNRAAEETFQRKEAEVLGKKPEDILFAPTGDDGGKQRVERNVSARQGSMLDARTEMHGIRANGDVFPLETTMTMRRVDGLPVLTFFLRDISDRKRWEDVLRKAKEAAETASRAKGDFLANMSHEIRTPMNAIIGITELVIDSELTDSQRDYLKMVRESGHSLLALLNDILDFSKIEAGKLDFDYQPFDPRESLGDAVKTFAISAHSKGLELACRIHPNVPRRVVGDLARVKQVVVNLLGNAIKFTDAGEVVLELYGETPPDALPRLRFVVRDTGIGIPKEKRQAVFGAFEQADTSTNRRFGGTGLGLAVSSKLVECMGGQIWVESQVDQGSQFHFTLPLELPPEETDHARRPDPPELAGVPVLVVDDNATNRQLLEEVLDHWGMNPKSVSTADEAMRCLAEARDQGAAFRLVLIDAGLSGPDGFHLAQRIQADQPSDLPVLMMLASGDRENDMMRCEKLGHANYLLKPIKQSELLRAAVTALGGATPHDRSSRAASSGRSKPGRSLKILLAEDSLVNQKLAVGLLKKRGHEVLVADNGAKAIAALASDEFDLVLMDVQMPEMDGLEATASIRHSEKSTGAHIPIIAMTAHAMKGDRELCLSAGMDDYVAKPIRASELFEKIQSVLDG